MKRPHIILSTAMSLDGYIDDSSQERLILSDEKDFARVDALRASCDGILIGANTIRKDNPRLLLHDESLIASRLEKNAPPHPIKITLSESGNLSADSRFFTQGETEKYIYTHDNHIEELTAQFASIATVISAGKETIHLETMFNDLHNKGLKSVFVEGGTTLTTSLVQAGLVDEWYIAIAGFFVADANAPRFVTSEALAKDYGSQMTLVDVKQVGNMAILQYRL